MTLPNAWRDKFGELEKVHELDLKLTSGEIRQGEIFAPLRIQIDNFRQIFGEVLFMEMEPDERGNYKPLIGYLPLEAIPVGVDMLNHRLFKVRAKAE